MKVVLPSRVFNAVIAGLLAIVVASAVTAQSPIDAKTLRDAGFTHIQKGEWAAANLIFGNLLVRYPNDGPGRYGKAVALFNLQQLDEADVLLSGLIGDPANKQSVGLLVDSLVLSAVIESVKGRNESAIAKLENAVALSPGHFDAQFSLARARYSTGDIQRAVAGFRNTVAIRPEHQRARFFYATALEQVGQASAATHEYREMLRRDPKSVDGRTGLGILLIKTEPESLPEGIRLLREAVLMDPANYEAQVTLGKALIKSGEPAAAIGPLDLAAKIDKSNPEPYFQLSIAYRRLGRLSEAEAASARVKAIHESRRRVANNVP